MKMRSNAEASEHERAVIERQARHLERAAAEDLRSLRAG
jgi:hypothetical protein